MIRSLDTGKGRIFPDSLPRSSPVTKTYNPLQENTILGAMMEVDTIEQLKQKYPDEWIIVEVLEEDENGRVLDARLLGHSRSKEEINEIMMSFDGYSYTFYSGKIPGDGQAFAF